MIELRWVEREVTRHTPGEPIACVTTERVLQYRTWDVDTFSEGVYGRATILTKEGRHGELWTDWRDVPVVQP